MPISISPAIAAEDSAIFLSRLGRTKRPRQQFLISRKNKTHREPDFQDLEVHKEVGSCTFVAPPHAPEGGISLGRHMGNRGNLSRLGRSLKNLRLPKACN